jgi:hypothetical protein
VSWLYGAQLVMREIPGEVKSFLPFHAAAMLFYNERRIAERKGGASFTLTSQVRASVMLILASEGNYKMYEFNGITSITNLIRIRPGILGLERGHRPTDGQTDTISPICVHSVHIVRRTHENVNIKIQDLTSIYLLFSML